MTPQETFEYKIKWKPNAWKHFIDPDADVWSKTWCRSHLEKRSWSFEPYAREDDWHMMLFQNKHDYMHFKSEYESRFPTKA